MSQRFADIIIDISHEAIDRTFQYKIPERLEGQVHIGMSVSIPFGRGNSMRKGYVTGISDTPKIDESKLKEIASVSDKGVAIEGSLIELAAFIKETYGSTMINALKTVMPIKDKVRGLVKKEVRLKLKPDEIEDVKNQYEKKHAKAKLRLLTELSEDIVIPYQLVTGKLNISSQTLNAMVKEGVIVIEEEGYYRTVFKDGAADINAGAGAFANYRGDLIHKGSAVSREIPNDEQQAAIDKVVNDYTDGNNGTYLLKGITGSGKTLVYIEIIDHILSMGKQAIVLIPEIALTYQTVKRFRRRFGDKVTIMNSKLSKGERYDQFERAKKGEVSVIIGPRSALFAPFPNLGIIVIDEEHETTYKSDQPPKYHAREVAIHRAGMCGASVVLGSATPSIESYHKALMGEYHLLTLTKRARENAELARVSVVDMREELKNGNRSMFSEHLKEQIKDRLDKKEQIMLFLNRRGYAGFVSCRACGHVFFCPHCDVSLTVHDSGSIRERLVCHYCGYEEIKPKRCPSCTSTFIAGFGVGTQKVEEQVKSLYPEAKVLRMDMDTTKKKDAHEKILDAFANGEADVLVGTQMIVKGHDFPGVTLVGIVAADTTLFESDYKAAEKTFDLLTQAAGRAGRGDKPGEVVVQTYKPDHYCISSAAKQDYDAFYEEEKAYRKMLSYPPFSHMMAIFMEAPSDKISVELAESIRNEIEMAVTSENASDEETISAKDREKSIEIYKDGWSTNEGVRYKSGYKADVSGKNIQTKIRIIGPCEAGIYKIADRFRRVIYIKDDNVRKLTAIKDYLEEYLNDDEKYKECYVSFDLDPMRSY